MISFSADKLRKKLKTVSDQNSTAQTVGKFVKQIGENI
jgi:hypothetical protein